MAISLGFSPLFCHQKQLSPPKITLLRVRPLTNTIPISATATHSRYFPTCRCSVKENIAAVVPPDKPRWDWEEWLAAGASLYPIYVTVGGTVAFFRPSTFSWFVDMGPTSYSFTLGFIMLSMGITLEFKELINLFRQRPLSGERRRTW